MQYTDYLINVKKSSNNTVLSYKRDLKKMCDYFAEQGLTDIKKINSTNINSYMIYLEKNSQAVSTISRYVASIKAYFEYARDVGAINTNPAKEVKAPKVKRKLPEILSVEEVLSLLDEPNTATEKGMRDKAMLELLYGTGIRVSELINLNIDDVNLDMGYINCDDGKKSRIIPINDEAKRSVKAYIKHARSYFVKDENIRTLFTNCSGIPMSRQGFWKLIKTYGERAGINKDITPYTFRHSFAAHLVGNGADLKSLQEMMGYSDLTTTQVYATVANNRIRDVYHKAHPRDKM